MLVFMLAAKLWILVGFARTQAVNVDGMWTYKSTSGHCAGTESDPCGMVSVEYKLS